MKRIAPVLVVLAAYSSKPLAAALQSGNPASLVQQHLASGQKLLAERNLDGAVQEFKAVIQLSSQNVEAQANLGVIEFLRGNCEAATEKFHTALKLNSKLWNVYALLGFCELRQNETALGRGHLERAFPNLTDSQLRVQAGLFLVQLYRQTGEATRATATIIRLQELDGENVNVQYAAYRLYSDLADQAVTTLSAAHPDSARIRQIVAQRLIERGDIDGAIKAYREALSIDPHLTGAHFELGEALLRKGSNEELDEAKKQLVAALVDNPHDAEAECMLGDLAYRTADNTSAEEHFTRALQIEPSNPDAHVGIGKVYLSSEHYDRAIAEFKSAILADPAQARAHYLLARAYARIGEMDRAKQELATYKSLESSKKQLQFLFGRANEDGDMMQTQEPAFGKE